MILIAPIKTEKSVGKIEFDNVVTFEVALKATRDEVKKEVEKLFSVKVDKVRTYITPKGKKRAAVKLNKDSSADSLTTKLKIA